MHWAVAGARAAIGFLVVVAAAATLVSGGDGTDPQTPPALPGLPPPFLGTAVIGSGGRTAAIDAYGDVVDLRMPGPAGQALIDNPANRQAAGTVPADTGIVARTRLPNGHTVPFWRADSIQQRYLPDTNVLRTVARFGGGARVVIVRRVGGAAAARADRHWVASARPLSKKAPGWARRMYARSLLVLRALTDRRTGAVAAGARDGWAYVWPRDASTVAIAFASAGYRAEARRVVRFLRGLDLNAAARFLGDGTPVGGRGAQGDAAGWVAAAAEAAGLAPHPDSAGRRLGRFRWRDRADYQEGSGGDYLGNAIASAGLPPNADALGMHGQQGGGIEIRRLFGGPGGLLTRRLGDRSSGVDSAAAWAIRPFSRPALFQPARRSLDRLLSCCESRFGIVPSEDWPGTDPWTAPTAWTAWAFAALARSDARAARPAAALRDHARAMGLLGDLRRAATATGMLPERVDVRTGVPRSTTPLAWSHALAILALRELWP